LEIGNVMCLEAFDPSFVFQENSPTLKHFS
jgi:hypothetical protein